MHWSSDESLWRQMEVEQETAGMALEMETAEGEEAMIKHLPECVIAEKKAEFTSWMIDECICDRLQSCERRTWAEMIARIEDRMTDTDMDNLVSDDGKDYFWSVLRSMAPVVRYLAQSSDTGR
jgi:hypothetical protein